METTLIILKPAIASPKATVATSCNVLKRPASSASAAAKMRCCSDKKILLEHYAHIAAKPFFPEVEEFMQSSPVIALALDADNAIEKVRALLGPTDSKKAAPGTIRGDFGVDVMVNVVHASNLA